MDAGKELVLFHGQYLFQNQQLLHEHGQHAINDQQAFINLRSGHPKRLPPPVEGYLDRIDPHERALLDQILSCAAIGSSDTVKKSLLAFIEQTKADELMITSQIFNHSARLRSYEITARIHQELRQRSGLL